MTTSVSRREVLAGAGAILAGTAACAATRKASTAAETKGQPFGYCLNTSTIRGQRLGLAREVEVAAQSPGPGKRSEATKALCCAPLTQTTV